MATSKTEFTAPKKDLIAALARAASVTPRRAALPILMCARVEFAEDSVSVSATDLYMAVDTAVEASGKAGGVIIAGAKDLLTRVQAMPTDTVTLSCEDSRIIVKAKGTKRRFTMTSVSADGYPELEGKPAKAQNIELTGAELTRLLAQSSYAASQEKDRAAMNGVFIEPGADSCAFVATNGHQISKSVVKRKGLSDGSAFIVPLAATQELKKLAEMAGKNTVTLCTSDTQLFVALDHVQFSAKLVDAQFPPYQQVIPERCLMTIEADRQDLANAIQAVSMSASVNTGGVRMTVTDGSLKLEAESTGLGEGSDEIQCAADGNSAPIGFNSSMMLATLGSLSCERVRIGVSGELDPIVITPAEATEGEDFIAVIMPMRL